MGILGNLPHVGTFYRRSWTTGTYGGARATETAVWSAVSCWVQSASASTITEFQKRNQVVTHQVLVTTDPESYLRVDDVLRPTIGTFTGQVFDVRAFGERTSGLGWMWVVYLEKHRADAPGEFS